MLEHGFAARPLGPDNERARRAAWALVEEWVAIRDGRLPSAAKLPSKEMATVAKTYPTASIGAAWQEWIATAVAGAGGFDPPENLVARLDEADRTDVCRLRA